VIHAYHYSKSLQTTSISFAAQYRSEPITLNHHQPGGEYYQYQLVLPRATSRSDDHAISPGRLSSFIEGKNTNQSDMLTAITTRKLGVNII